ncbi:hypothetical protein [Halomarina pelagica]|uniref:hypothetical protein n=1 Tax=Halomarina pelagica TaxID=2961599 RepID=UPI0020C3F3D8|nr:hypothetical protein [Halomarina sp. BND7]
MLTFDDDFLSLAAADENAERAGIVYVGQYGKEVGELVRRVDAALRRNRDRDLVGEIVYA